MARRFYFRDLASDATGIATGVYRSYALDQAINNQPPSIVKPVNYYGGAIEPKLLSPDRGQLADGTSLSVDPPDTGSHTDANENWRGFLTHFVTPPLAAQRIRPGFVTVALKAIHNSATSTLQAEFSVYVVDDAGAVVDFLYDRDRIATLAFVAAVTAAGVVHRANIPCRGVAVPQDGRLVIEVWTRQTVTDAAGTEGIGAEFFLNGADESLGPTVGGAGVYDADSVATYADMPSDLILAIDVPVFAVRIDPLTGMRHSRAWATDVIPRREGSEQRTRLRASPNDLVEYTGVGYGTDEMELLDALVEKLSERPVWLPWWRDEQTLPTTLALGVTGLVIETVGYQYVAGERAIVWQNPFTWEVLTVDTVAPGLLTVVTGPVRDWIAGTASIMPLKDAVMLGGLKVDRLSAVIAEADLAFTVNRPGGFLVSGVTGPPGLPAVACGLVLWLKADSLLGTLTQDDAVTLWPDVSGNGRDAVQLVPEHWPKFSENTINGWPTVYFNSLRLGADPTTEARCLEFGDVFSASAPSPVTGAEVFVVLRNVLATPDSDYDSGLWRFGDDPTNFTHYPAPDSVVYDGFGSLGRHTTGVFPVVPITPHIYNVTSIPGEWTNRFNGVQLYTSAVNTVRFNVNPGIGRSQSSAVSSIYNYKGFIAEILMYDCKLSDADRSAVLQYLSTKYNIAVA